MIFFYVALNGSNPYTAPTLDPGVPQKPSTNCPSVYSHKVYETIDKQTDQVAIENITSSRVHVYVWLPMLSSAYTESYNAKRFTNKFINTRFKFIGNTTDGKLMHWHTNYMHIMYTYVSACIFLFVQNQ